MEQNSQEKQLDEFILDDFYTDENIDSILKSVDVEKIVESVTSTTYIDINAPSTSKSSVSFKVDISSPSNVSDNTDKEIVADSNKISIKTQNKISVKPISQLKSPKIFSFKGYERKFKNPWLKLVHKSGLPLLNWPTLIRNKIFLSECGNRDKCFFMSFVLINKIDFDFFMEVLKFTNKNFNEIFKEECKRSYKYIKSRKDKYCIYYAFHLKLRNIFCLNGHLRDKTTRKCIITNDPNINEVKGEEVLTIDEIISYVNDSG